MEAGAAMKGRFRVADSQISRIPVLPWRRGILEVNSMGSGIRYPRASSAI